MKTNFGIDNFKLLKNLEFFNDGLIFSNGQSFIIYDYVSMVLAETVTDLLDYLDIYDDREDCIEELEKAYSLDN